MTMSRRVNARRFSKVIRQLAKVPSQATRIIAKDLTAEIQANFDRGVDPDRRPWQRLKKSTLARGRHPPPLTDTRAGRESVLVQPGAGAGLRFTVGKIYMVYHQRPKVSPRRNFPRRMFLPEDKWPRAWDEILLYRYEQMARGIIDRA